jgi:hypothetical protein
MFASELERLYLRQRYKTQSAKALATLLTGTVMFAGIGLKLSNHNFPFKVALMVGDALVTLAGTSYFGRSAYLFWDEARLAAEEMPLMHQRHSVA